MAEALSSLSPKVSPANAEAAAWARKLRDASASSIDASGLPNRRVEQWRYSNLAQALAEEPRPPSFERAAPDIPGTYRIDFKDGRLSDSLATPPAGLEIQSLSSVLHDDTSPFAAVLSRTAFASSPALACLNAANLQEGAVVRLGPGIKLAAPLHLRFDWSQTAAQTGHLNILIVLEAGAEATMVETHVGAPGFATVVTELSLAPDTHLSHVRLETLNAAARQAAITGGVLAERATYKAIYLSEGAHFARHEVSLKLDGEEAKAALGGISLLSGRRHGDNTAVITHAAPLARSEQIFRAVLTDKARGVYQGCVKVQREGQQTDARQLSRTLLLSRAAEMAIKPELEIFADDVKCGHGATTGELDEAALFFMRARGVTEAEARAMLIEAFLSEGLQDIGNEALREAASKILRDWLALHAVSGGDVE